MMRDQDGGSLSMRRFVAVLLAAVLSSALPATGGERTRPARVGFMSASHGLEEELSQSFVAGMRELGWVEGRNIVYIDRSVRGQFERIPELARAMVADAPDVIVAPPVSTAVPLRRLTSSIPIVFMMVSDPVGSGLVASLSRPGGNATGLFAQTETVAAKMVEILSEALPRARRFTLLANPANPAHAELWRRCETAAKSMGIAIERVDARSYEDLEGALDILAKRRTEGIIVLSDPLFVSRREIVVKRITEARIAAIYAFGEFAEIGGLLAYGVDLHAQFRRAATTVDRILKGGDPAVMPVEQPVRFALTVNRGAAERIGLALPREFLLRADRVIP
jgi:ABC-type uncharacterized transport system substrate-binding protein